MTFTQYAYAFPSPLKTPSGSDGIVAVRGDLHPQRLLAAYSLGIFPWYNPGDPILWWSPDPRCILRLEDFRLPRRSRRRLARQPFSLTLDGAFGEVVKRCAAPRKGQTGSWLTQEMREAYGTLNAMGYAHSVEAWRGGELIGGLYGVALGRVFFGESMFHLETDASRCCLAGLVGLLRQRGAVFLDCQQVTPHMVAMGARPVPRLAFQVMLGDALACGFPFRDPVMEPSGFRQGMPSNVPDCETCPWSPWTVGYVHCGDGRWEEVGAGMSGALSTSEC